ncbi:MAG: tetratricopeptide repeat protein [Deltaproteobacteria bacterium]|nr:tetratricopeptide repeat protein [Deltaproteobacteria bacterium]
MLKHKNYNLYLFLPFLAALILFSPSKSYPREGFLPSEELIMSKGFFRDGLYSLAVKELEAYGAKGLADEEECLYNSLLGKSYFHLHRFEEAIRALKIIIKERCSLSEQEKAYYYLGDSYFNLSQMESARETFERLIYLYPQSSLMKETNNKLGKIVYMESLSYLENSEYKDALRGFDLVLQLKPRHVKLSDLYSRKGDALLYLERYAEAEAAYKQASKYMDDDEQKGPVEFQLALIRYYLKDYGKAISKINDFLKDYPEHALTVRARNTLLWSLYRQGNYQDALAYLDTMEAGGGKVPESDVKDLVNTSSRLILLGDYREAVDMIETALKNYGKDPLDGEVMLLLSEAYGGIGREDMEEATFREIIKRYGSSPAGKKSLYSLGELNFRKGLPKEAADYFREYLENDSLGNLAAEASFYLAQSLFKMGEIDEAQRHFFDIMERYKGSELAVRSAIRVADIEALSGKYLSAAKIYDSVIKKAPRGEKAGIQWKMAEAYRKGNELKYAARAYARYIKKYPEGKSLSSANIYLAEIHYLLGDYKKGIKRYSKIVDSKGKEDFDPSSAIKLAWGYIKLKSTPDAEKILDLVIKKHPESSEAATAYYLKGWLAQEARMLEKANKEYKKLLKKFDDLPIREDVKWQLGINQFVLGDYKDAIKTFRDFSVDFTDSHRNSEEMIRKSYAALGEFKRAVESSSTFFDVSPDKTVDLKKRCDEAVALFEVGSYGDALKLSEKIINQFPTQSYSARAMLTAGEIYFKRGMPKEAKRYFTMAQDVLTAGSLKSFTSYRLGEIAYMKKDYRGAVMELEGMNPALPSGNKSDDDLKIFINFDFMVARGLFIKGSSYLSLNLVERGLESYRKFLDFYPAMEGLDGERLKAALAFQNHKDYEQTIKSMKELIKVSNDLKIKAEAQYWIGDCYQQSGAFDQAIVEYLKVTYLYPEESMWALTARYMAAQSYQEVGAYDKAIKLFNKVARESGDKRKREYAKKKVEELSRKLEGHVLERAMD